MWPHTLVICLQLRHSDEWVPVSINLSNPSIHYIQISTRGHVICTATNWLEISGQNRILTFMGQIFWQFYLCHHVCVNFRISCSELSQKRVIFNDRIPKILVGSSGSDTTGVLVIAGDTWDSPYTGNRDLVVWVGVSNCTWEIVWKTSICENLYLFQSINEMINDNCISDKKEKIAQLWRPLWGVWGGVPQPPQLTKTKTCLVLELRESTLPDNLHQWGVLERGDLIACKKEN